MERQFKKGRGTVLYVRLPALNPIGQLLFGPAPDNLSKDNLQRISFATQTFRMNARVKLR
jgi:hypothetical protein